MNKAELAELIDAYADARVSGNKYLCKEMITRLEDALTKLYETLDASSADATLG